MRMRGLVFAAAALAFAGAPVLSAGPVVPVEYGGEPDLDACGGQSIVTGLDPAGDNYLSVRAGPGMRYAVIGRLGPGTKVQVCDEKGRWIGIVYGDAGGDCGTGMLVAVRSAYRGPCQSGWVFGKYLTTVAG